MSLYDYLDVESEAKVVFMDEPGEHHLILKGVGENVNLEVIWFDDWASWKLTSDTEPRRVLTATVPLAEFHHAVTKALAGWFRTRRLQEKMVNANFGWNLLVLPETKEWHRTLFAKLKNWYFSIVIF